MPNKQEFLGNEAARAVDSFGSQVMAPAAQVRMPTALENIDPLAILLDLDVAKQYVVAVRSGRRVPESTLLDVAQRLDSYAAAMVLASKHDMMAGNVVISSMGCTHWAIELQQAARYIANEAATRPTPS